MKYKAINYSYNDGYYTVCLERNGKDLYFIDVKIDQEYKDVIVDWNQYIFTKDELKRKKIQDKTDEYEAASNEAIYYLEHNGEIRQKKNADWVQCSKFYKFFKKLFTKTKK